MNLRKGPATSYGVIRTLDKGEELEVLDSSNKDWVKVRTSKNETGWCSTEYIQFSGEEGSGTEETLVAKTTDYLNLRKGAGTSYGVITTLPKGTTVTVVDNSNSEWAKVRTSSGVEGWCSKEYLEFSESGGDNNSGSSSTEKKYIKTTTAVNFRTGAGTNYSVIRTLPSGTVLTLLDDTNADWVYAEDSNGVKGYISSEYVQEVSSSGVSITLSHTKVSIPALKTIYTTASCSMPGMEISWSSSNEKVATVQNGYIYGVSAGTATITASAGGAKAQCTVTVTAAEAVKSVYSDPNVVLVGNSVNLIAITDSLGKQLSLW